MTKIIQIIHGIYCVDDSLTPLSRLIQSQNHPIIQIIHISARVGRCSPNHPNHPRFRHSAAQLSPPEQHARIFQIFHGTSSVEDSLVPLHRPLQGQNLPFFHIFHISAGSDWRSRIFQIFHETYGVEDSLVPLYRPMQGQNLPIFHIFHDLLPRWRAGFQVGFPPCYA